MKNRRSDAVFCQEAVLDISVVVDITLRRLESLKWKMLREAINYIKNESNVQKTLDTVHVMLFWKHTSCWITRAYVAKHVCHKRLQEYDNEFRHDVFQSRTRRGRLATNACRRPLAKLARNKNTPDCNDISIQKKLKWKVPLVKLIRGLRSYFKKNASIHKKNSLLWPAGRDTSESGN